MGRRSLGLVALVAVGVAYAWPMQVPGIGQTAHYALVKALSEGVPYVDGTLGETGDLSSDDVATIGGHTYAVKAPGLAFAALPTYVVAKAAGMRTTGDPMRALWLLNLLTSAVATVVLLLLVRDLANRIEPGFGSATAVILGLGALTLPFATLFFSHALATTASFAAFWLLWREREGPARIAQLAAAGFLAGFALMVDHLAFWSIPALAVYAFARQRPVVRLATFGAGGFVGILPYLAFNLWAFGNPLHTPYVDYWDQRGLEWITASWDSFALMLFSSLGLFTLAPILLAGVAGMVLLYRRGRRAEALVTAAVPLSVLAYCTAFGAFGGLGPPRYLTSLLPFALLPLALALRAWPLTTLALGAVTCFQAVVMTATGPLAAYDGEWLLRAENRQFMLTAASFLGVTGWYAILPFFAAVAGAVALAALATPRVEPRLTDAALAVTAVGAWALLAVASTNRWGKPPSNEYVIVVFALLAVGALAAGLIGRLRRGAAALVVE